MFIYWFVRWFVQRFVVHNGEDVRAPAGEGVQQSPHRGHHVPHAGEAHQAELRQTLHQSQISIEATDQSEHSIHRTRENGGRPCTATASSTTNTARRDTGTMAHYVLHCLLLCSVLHYVFHSSLLQLHLYCHPGVLVPTVAMLSAVSVIRGVGVKFEVSIYNVHHKLAHGGRDARRSLNTRDVMLAVVSGPGQLCFASYLGRILQF